MKNQEKIDFEAAYLQTIYKIQDGKDQVAIHIGEINPALDELLERCTAKSWAFVTAYNPFSEKLSLQENQSRQSELLNYLRQKNFRFLVGYGESRSKDWEPEPSASILDISFDDAFELGKSLEQNAIVFGEAGSTPKLVWCR